MVQPLIRLIKHRNNYRVAEGEIFVHPKPKGDLFLARTIGDVEDAASNFPEIPSPNSYSIEGAVGRIGDAGIRASVQLYFLREDEYREGLKIFDRQRRALKLV